MQYLSCVLYFFDIGIATTPWFDHYREAFLDSVQVLEHEYVRYYMAGMAYKLVQEYHTYWLVDCFPPPVILVVSSRQARPADAFASLYRAQKEAETDKFPFWLKPHVFYYHVLVHDVQEGSRKQWVWWRVLWKG